MRQISKGDDTFFTEEVAANLPLYGPKQFLALSCCVSPIRSSHSTSFMSDTQSAVGNRTENAKWLNKVTGLIARWMLLSIAAYLLAGCTLLSAYPTPLPSLIISRLEVPVFRQEGQRSCGVAAAKMVAAFHRKPLQDAPLANLHTEVDTAQGVSGASLQESLEESGYFTAVFAGTLDKASAGLLHHLDNGRPMIVMIGRPRFHHFVVVTGYNDESRTVYVNDPDLGAIALRYDLFLKVWNEANRFTLLAVPRNKDEM